MPYILAEIELSNNVAFPKENGVMTGYTPTHKFDNIKYLCSGRHEYPDNNWHYPGEKILTKIYFTSWEYIKDKIKVNDCFIITEVNRIVGSGKVLNIIDN